MTTPDLSYLIPAKWKPVTGFIGSGLTLVVPYVLAEAAEWPAWASLLVGLALMVLTALGIYRVPYLKPGTTVVAKESVPPGVPTSETVTGKKPPPPGGYVNPFPPIAP